jgi:SAM-dependent methyltransferase
MLDKYLNFNQFERDRYVEAWAKALPPGTKVLDVGAGPCRYRPAFAHCDYKTHDFAQHEGCGEGPLADKGQWAYGKLDYVSDAAAIPVADGAFDAVLCTEVLEHVPEPIRVVRELGRILRPGGRLLLTAPLGSGLHQEPHHYYGGYTPHWYRRFLPEAGFKDPEIDANGGFFKWFGQENQRFSVLIDPRKHRGFLKKILLFPVWLFTWPHFRAVMPVLCHYLDRLDGYRAFTVGYHVRAVKGG